MLAEYKGNREMRPEKISYEKIVKKEIVEIFVKKILLVRKKIIRKFNNYYTF